MTDSPQTEAEMVDALRRSIAGERPTPPASPAVKPEARHRFIGSGDIAAVAALYVPEWQHLAKWKTAADVYMRLVHGVDIPWRDNFTRGLALETRLRGIYRASIGPVTDPPPSTIRHRSLPWASASPDGLCGDAGLAEYKSWSCFQRGQWGAPGSDLVPDKYSLQGQWLLECTGRRWCHYLVEFGRDLPKRDGGGWLPEGPPEVFEVEHDAELVGRLVECGETFMREHVQPRRAPAVEPAHNKRFWKGVVRK